MSKARELAAKIKHQAMMRTLYPAKNDPSVKLLATVGATTLLDIGANEGQFAQRVRAGGYHGDIISFEPLSSAFGVLQEQSAADPRWRVDNVAVGAEPGEIEMHVAGNSVSSSILPMAQAHLEVAPDSRYVATEKVELTTVAALIEKHQIDPAKTVLKADTQGYESFVLDGAGDTLPSFAGLVLEMSLRELYEGQMLFVDLLNQVTQAGFVPWSLSPAYIDRTDGRMWWCDGYFVPAAFAQSREP